MREDVRRNVVWLGVVSFLADVAGEMVVPVLPLFLTVVLGAPPTVVGFVDGAAELSACFFRAVGGWWSDRAAGRKPVVIFGYTLSALSKPALAFALGWPVVVVCRVLDRAGKGLRGTARDALIAASVEKEHWGRAFGLHRAMDTAGAVLGPLLTLWLMERRAVSYRGIFTAASVPALAAVVVLILFVREAHEVVSIPVPAKRTESGRPPLPPGFWRFLGIYGLFAIGNSSDSFLLLRARQSGMGVGSVIAAYTLFNLVNATLAPGIGRRADRVGRRRTIAAGAAVYAVCYAGFAVAGASWLWPLFALYGLYAALMEGSLRAVISEFSVAENRGAAHGAFQSIAGLLAFAASVLAGALWVRFGPAAPFWFGAACAALASAALFRVEQ